VAELWVSGSIVRNNLQDLGPALHHLLGKAPAKPGRPQLHGLELGYLQNITEVELARGFADDLELDLGFHHPVVRQEQKVDRCITALDDDIRKASLAAVEQSLELASRACSRHLVVHAPSQLRDPAAASEVDGTRYRAMVAASMQRLDQLSREYNMPILIETDGPNPFYRTAKELVGLVAPYPHLAHCMDTKHFAVLTGKYQYPCSVAELVRETAPYTVSVHLSNTISPSGTGIDHRPPGSWSTFPTANSTPPPSGRGVTSHAHTQARDSTGWPRSSVVYNGVPARVGTATSSVAGCSNGCVEGVTMRPESDSKLLDFQQLYSDPFTGLSNLFSCLVDLSSQFDDPRSQEDDFVQLGLVDVDGLTELNDRLGRQVGDQVILLVKNTMLDVCGHSARIYRFSRDEFALVGSVSGTEAARDCACRVVDTYRRRAAELLAPAEGAPTVSMGVSVVDPAAASIGNALQNASDALSRAKQDGGDRAEVVAVRNQGPTRRQDLLTLFTERIIQTLDIIANVGQLALTDPLTGLPNQRAAQLHLTKLFDRPAQTSPSSVLLVDGDRLRDYNSQFGYNRGNQMIRDLVTFLKESKRKDDFLARWFVGDEFLLVLHGADTHAAGAVAERLRKAVEESTASWELPVTISIGTATYPDDTRDTEELIRLAQEACTQAKRRGKNQVVQAHSIAGCADPPH